MQEQLIQELVRRIDRLERLLDDATAQEIDVGSGLPTTTTAIYVAPHGSDAYSGRTLAAPKFTIAAGLSAASSLTPSATRPICVHVEAGRYVESFTVPSYVHLIGPAITVVGAITIQQLGHVELGSHYASASNQAMVTKDGAGLSVYRAHLSDARGEAGSYTVTNNIVNQTNNAILFVEVAKMITSQFGRGVRDYAALFGHVHFAIKDLYLGASTSFGLDAGANSNLIGSIDHILKLDAAYTGTEAITVASGGVVQLTASGIEADSAWTVTGGGSLWLQCPRIVGAQTGTRLGLPTATEVGAVPATGGTFTGNVTVTGGVNAGSASGAGAGSFRGTNTGFIEFVITSTDRNVRGALAAGVGEAAFIARDAANVNTIPLRLTCSLLTASLRVTPGSPVSGELYVDASGFVKRQA